MVAAQGNTIWPSRLRQTRRRIFYSHQKRLKKDRRRKEKPDLPNHRLVKNEKRMFHPTGLSLRPRMCRTMTKMWKLRDQRMTTQTNKYLRNRSFQVFKASTRERLSCQETSKATWLHRRWFLTKTKALISPVCPRSVQTSRTPMAKFNWKSARDLQDKLKAH